MITFQIPQHNSYFSNVSSVTTHKKLKWLSPSLFKSLKSEQHKATKVIVEKHRYKPSVAATLHELVNCSNKEGQSRVSHEVLALRLRCSKRTISRHMNIFKNDGLIGWTKTGWKHSNLTSLLFIQHLNCNKEDKMSHYPTPPEAAQTATPHGGCIRAEKEENESFWDDDIPIKPINSRNIFDELRRLNRGDMQIADVSVPIF